MTYKKKLIEVALPLDAINKASAREKSIRHGHPSTLHLWWARRPLAAARAVIFSQMVDDPSGYVDELLADPKTRQAAEKTYRARLQAWEERKTVFDKASAAGMSAAANPDPGTLPTLENTAASLERQRLFRIIEDLVLWENTTNEKVLEKARAEIHRSWRRTCADNADHPRAAELFDPDQLPAFHDPFAGGGALPLEAQRLGLESYASDLNPVAVLINKAMIEIPPKFAGQPPVNPEARTEQRLIARKWRGAEGLAEDVGYYGQWMRDEAEKRIGHLYPKVEITSEMVQERPDLKPYKGQKLTVIAWLWVRTIKSPNPAFAHVDVPLASTFMLSTKAGKEAYIEPMVSNDDYHFMVKLGKPRDLKAAKNGTKLSRGANFQCIMSRTPMGSEYIRSEFHAKHIGLRLMAIVVEGERERVYLSPTREQEMVAKSANPVWWPEQEMNQKTSNLVSGRGYGITHWYEIFTSRQLVALTTFSDLIKEARELVQRDALSVGLSNDNLPLRDSGTGVSAYADAVAIYLGLAVDKTSDYNSSLVIWSPTRNQAKTSFSRQAIPMVWDFAEINTFANAAGDISVSLKGITRSLAEKRVFDG
jgi:putative DNA methylase